MHKETFEVEVGIQTKNKKHLYPGTQNNYTMIKAGSQ